MKIAERFFTAEEQERIHQAVIDAEQRTSGEIVPMIVGASRRYAEVEVMGMATGLLLGTGLAFFSYDPLGSVPAPLVWPATGAIVGFLLCRIPGIKRRLIPRTSIDEAVHTRSLAAFTEHGLHYTKDHTGVLILTSLLEHRVEVLADRGINEKVHAGTWEEVVATITAGLRSGNGCQAFCRAIERCGEILASHFPRLSDDRDELRNQLIREE